MSTERLTGAKRRVLDLLKRHGPGTPAEIADALGLTVVAVRQHLQQLEAFGLVEANRVPQSGRGRPSQRWSLTDEAHDLFPDRHGELTAELIGALRKVHGDEGLARVIDVRSERQADEYRRLMPAGKATLKSKVEALAGRRDAEGYMAEVVTERPDCYLLVEHHCPICEAAKSCLGLCQTELELFRNTLGPEARVERVEHLLSGDDRCAYRITGSGG